MLNMYQKVKLTRDIPEYDLKRGDSGYLLDFVHHPENKETGCVLELEGKETPIFIATVPMSALDLI